MILQNIDELESKNKAYDANIEYWTLWRAAYEGGDEFIARTLKQHIRETKANHALRVEEAEVFNYCSTIINTFARFVSGATVTRELGNLANDALFQQFLSDVDKTGVNYDIFWDRLTELVGVYGFLGLLLDTPQVEQNSLSVADAKRDGIYPYIAVFTPENIWDWKFDKTKSGRKRLKYIKLAENDGTLLLKDLETWERWAKNKDDIWEIIDKGENKVGEIPFIWYVNYKIPNAILGLSDIRSIARIQQAITRNLSHGSEIIKYAAFPMLAAPQAGPSEQPTDETDAVGVTAVIEFDPETPNAIPKWIEAAVKEPVDAVLMWTAQKVEEIYRSSSMSTFYGQKAEAKSGIALRFEFQQLLSIVRGKANALDEAETAILRWWNTLRGLPDNQEISVTRSKNFNIDDLKIELENLIIGKTQVRSEEFKKQIEKKIVRLVLSEVRPEIMSAIDTEIESKSIDVFEGE